MTTIRAICAASALLLMAGCASEAPDAVEATAEDNSFSDVYDSQAVAPDAGAADTAAMPDGVPLEPNARPPEPKADADF